MKYCPVCGAEYHDTIEVCADCEEHLISPENFQRKKAEEEQFQKDTKTLVKVFTLKNRFEADLIKGELEREGIPVLIRNFRDTAYNGIYIPQKGWGEVRVPESKKDRAEEIISALENAIDRGAVGIDEGKVLGVCPSCTHEIPLDSGTCPHCDAQLDPSDFKPSESD